MFKIFGHDYVRAANDERRTRALDRYERLRRHRDGSESVAVREAEIVEVAFTDGLPLPNEVSA